MTNQELGQRGESIATHFLQKKGYTIIDRNWHCAAGELDIIAQQDSEWVFIEVKTRLSHTTQDSFASISPSKQKKLIAAVYQYLANNALESALWRIDAIGIAIPRTGQPIIDHVENALDW